MPTQPTSSLPAGYRYGWEPVFSGDAVIGRIAGADFGYSIGSFIAHAFVDADHTTPGSKVRVRYSGTFYNATIVKGPLIDPDNTRLT